MLNLSPSCACVMDPPPAHQTHPREANAAGGPAWALHGPCWRRSAPWASARTACDSIRATLSVMLSDAVDDGILMLNPVLGINRKGRKSPDSMSRKDWKRNVKAMTHEQTRHVPCFLVGSVLAPQSCPTQATGRRWTPARRSLFSPDHRKGAAVQFSLRRQSGSRSTSRWASAGYPPLRLHPRRHFCDQVVALVERVDGPFVTRLELPCARLQT